MRTLIPALTRRALFAGLFLLAAWASDAAIAQGTKLDPLPSWNAGPTKQGIVDFVGRVTASGGADYVPPERRIATFDNDGTLWAEQPVYFQLAFRPDHGARASASGLGGDAAFQGRARRRQQSYGGVRRERSS